MFIMSKKRILFAITVILLCLLFTIGRKYLVIDEEPKKVDVIIVLSGDKGRLEKAANLYKEDYAEYVMLSRANDPNLTIQEAIDFGVPKSSLILEEKATSTYTNALYAKSEMEKLHLSSAIIVSSDYHMRRIQMTFDQVFKGTDMEFLYIAGYENGRPWYASKGYLGSTLSEFLKLIGYKLKLYEFIDID